MKHAAAAPRRRASTTLTTCRRRSTQRWWAGQSTSSQGERPEGRSRPGRRAGARGSSAMADAAIDRGTDRAAMRIAIDIDSTLHHYWDPLAAASRAALRRRPALRGADSPGMITRLREEQLAGVRSPRPTQTTTILAAEPYPGAVETSRPGTTAATSSTSPATAPSAATRRPRAGWPTSACAYDDLYCSFDKVTRCIELRHRRADRRQPGEPRRRARGRHRRRDAGPPVEPRGLRGPRTSSAPRTGPALAAALERRCSAAPRAA